MENLASLLHLLLCKRKHIETDCCWYLEGQMANAWTLPEHSLWLNKAESMVKLSGGEGPEKLNTLLNQVVEILRKTRQLVDGDPSLALIVKMIITETVATL
jgi:hypothetical protein